MHFKTVVLLLSYYTMQFRRNRLNVIAELEDYSGTGIGAIALLRAEPQSVEQVTERLC